MFNRRHRLGRFLSKASLFRGLGFFSEKEFEPQSIFVFLKSIKKKLTIKKIAYEQSFNRHLFFLHLDKDVIKTEFTYFPFTALKHNQTEYGVKVDSLLDIAVNKLFTIYQKPRVRDFIDLYLIIRKEHWPINELINSAKIKFDWHVDPLQLGSQFMQSTALKDYPRMIKEISPKVWQDFFIKQARLLGKDIMR